MATLPSSFFLSASSPSSSSFSVPRRAAAFLRPKRLTRSASSIAASNSAADHSFSRFQPSKKSILADLILEIEPLDVSLIQKDVPPATIDAMKRTISGMLGLLPSDQFQVLVEALWEPLSKLLVSSMMTGYTLRNAEYRLCLEKNLDADGENLDEQATGSSSFDVRGMLLESANMINPSAKDKLSTKPEKMPLEPSEEAENEGLDNVPPEAQEYILHLQSQLSSIKEELNEVERRSAALKMQQFVGEEKNDLLDYLRSLQPEKVAELSEPTSPEVKETIHSVVHGLLATLSPKMHLRAPPVSDNAPPTGTAKVDGGDTAEIVENTSLQFRPFITLTRDYLARLLFWCMLLGHYLRGLEYRTQLIELLSVNAGAESDGLLGDS